MAEKFPATATCLCGAVTIQAAALSTKADACHCGMCRKWGGGPLLAVDGGSQVTIEGAEHVTVFNSSEWAERGFCNRCGTHLFYHLKDLDRYIMPAGLFSDAEDRFQFTHQIFIDHKPAFYEFANATSNLTETEVIAQFAPPPK
ncbi:MAG: GFA family protein [Marinobacter sp.]|uniref:GFA family protein n=1 Tax=Marinobacter sp. TaxID=50741 RepID=UPI00299DBED6|nr:GFA family protein [Marinobacter sp.]MDX1754541.1 GFA family protein [Marinobacter sp.]